MFLVEAELKRGIPARWVIDLRERWVNTGKERKLKRLCRSASRYVIAGSKPLRVLWLLRTEKRAAADLIKGHFGRIWKIKIFRVSEQTIGRALRGR